MGLTLTWFPVSSSLRLCLRNFGKFKLSVSRFRLYKNCHLKNTVLLLKFREPVFPRTFSSPITVKS